MAAGNQSRDFLSVWKTFYWLAYLPSSMPVGSKRKALKGLQPVQRRSNSVHQTSPILSIRYQRPKTEITVSRLSGTWLHLFTSDQRPTPTALCILIHLHHPTPLLKHLWMIMPELCMPQESLLIGYSLALLFEVMLWFLNSADNGSKSREGCQKGRLPAFS